MKLQHRYADLWYYLVFKLGTGLGCRASAAATSAAVGLLGDAVGAGVGVGAGAAGGAAFFVGVSSSSSLRTASAFSFDARGRRCGERERGAA